MELAYNLDAAFTQWVVKQGYLQEPFVLADVGVQHGEHPRWHQLGDYLVVHGFDAIAEAVDELTQRNAPVASIHAPRAEEPEPVAAEAAVAVPVEGAAAAVAGAPGAPGAAPPAGAAGAPAAGDAKKGEEKKDAAPAKAAPGKAAPAKKEGGKK